MIQISYLIIYIAQTFTCTVLQEKHFQKYHSRHWCSDLLVVLSREIVFKKSIWCGFISCISLHRLIPNLYLKVNMFF